MDRHLGCVPWKHKCPSCKLVSNYQWPAFAVPFQFFFGNDMTSKSRNAWPIKNLFFFRLAVWCSSSLPWALWWWVQSDVNSGAAPKMDHTFSDKISFNDDMLWPDVYLILPVPIWDCCQSYLLFWRRLKSTISSHQLLLPIKNNRYQILFNVHPNPFS